MQDEAQLPLHRRPIMVSRGTPRSDELLDEVRINHMSVVWALVSWLLILMGIGNALIGLGVLALSEQTSATALGLMCLTFGLVFFGLGFRARRDERTRVEARRIALLEGVPCPARLKRVRPAIGLKITFMQPDFLHVFDVQLPDHRVVEHALRLPMDERERLDDREDLLALVHLETDSVFVPECFGRPIQIVD